MAGIWIYSEEAILAKEMMTLAKELAISAPQAIGIITLDEDRAKELSALGAAKIVVLKGSSTWPEAYEQTLAETLQAENANIVLFGGTVRDKAVAAAVAARLEAGLATDGTNVRLEENKLVVERIIYGGLAVSTEEMTLPALVTIPAHSYDIVAAADSSSEIVIKEATVTMAVSVDNVTKIERQGVDITKADRVVGIGRGVGKQEDLVMIEELASILEAEIGCTRPISEDAKWYPVERYIGISGKIVKPSLYIAIGTSGQIQHIAGVRDSKVIVAINTNEKEPIFTAADYAIVGSYADIVPALIDALKK